MSKAAQGFLPEAYCSYVEDVNPRRTPLIGKRVISGWKLIMPHGTHIVVPGKILPGHISHIDADIPGSDEEAPIAAPDPFLP